MPLAARVIPVMLVNGKQLVKGRQFSNERVVGHALQAARVHASRSVDELMILDVTATAQDRGPDLAMVEELTEDCFIPVTVGGGIKTIEQIRMLLKVGADKVLLGAAAHGNSYFIRQAADKFGSQAIVVSVDKPSYGHFHDQAMRYAKAGAGEILLGDRERDGTMQGYNLHWIRMVSRHVSVPVIACGGCSGYEDMVNALRAGASAVGVGAFFQFEDATPREAASFLAAEGILAREQT